MDLAGWGRDWEAGARSWETLEWLSESSRQEMRVRETHGGIDSRTGWLIGLDTQGG